MDIYKNRDWLESEEFPFHAMLYPFDAGEIKEPHAHEFIEFVYIAGGCGEHDLHRRRHPISAGDVFIIAPNVVHAYHSSGDQPLLVYNMLFQPSVLSAELRTLFQVDAFVDFFYMEPFLRKYAGFQTQFKLRAADHTDMLNRLQRMLNEYRSKESGYRLAIKTILLDTLIFLSRCYDRSKYAPMISLGSEEEAIRQLCRYIEVHYDQALSLTQACKLCGMSVSAFSAKFKGITGRTFIEFRNEVRIREAARLIRETRQNISLIAMQTGFDDLSFFNKQFKNAIGLTPSRYRAEG